MKQYDITIIGSGLRSTTLASQLGDSYRILLVDKNKTDLQHIKNQNIEQIHATQYRNCIKNDQGYTVVLHKDRKNILICTKVLIQAD
jgi:L-2-hydroxyglutarate oxidase LhgO